MDLERKGDAFGSKITVKDFLDRFIDYKESGMLEEGYAPRSVSKPFGLLRQAMDFAVVLDFVTKNPCEYCKSPRIQCKKMQVLDREERTRMLKLAQANIDAHGLFQLS